MSSPAAANPDLMAGSRSLSWMVHKVHNDIVKAGSGTPSYKGYGTSPNDRLDPGTAWTHADFNWYFKCQIETSFDFYVPEFDVDKCIIIIGFWNNVVVVSRESGEIMDRIFKKFKRNSLKKVKKFDAKYFDEDQVMYSLEDMAYWYESGEYIDPNKKDKKRDAERKRRLVNER